MRLAIVAIVGVLNEIRGAWSVYDLGIPALRGDLSMAEFARHAFGAALMLVILGAALPTLLRILGASGPTNAEKRRRFRG